MMKRVDFVIAGNQFLKSEVLPYNPNMEVIPTSIDLSRYSLKEDFHSRRTHYDRMAGKQQHLKIFKTPHAHL